MSLEVRKLIEDDCCILTLVGRIDESLDLSSIDISNYRKLVFDFAGVTLINSLGVHAWVKFIASVPLNVEIFFKKCPSVIVNQINIFAGFTGNGKVKIESVYAPYYCDRCDKSDDILVPITADFAGPPDISCDKAGCQLEFDDLDHAYFKFCSP